MHRFVCDLDSVRNQADGEPQRVAGAARGAGGDFVFQVVLQGRVRKRLPAWREVKDWPGKVVGVCDYAARARGTRAPTSPRLAEDGSPHRAAQRLAEDGSPHRAVPRNNPFA